MIFNPTMTGAGGQSVETVKVQFRSVSTLDPNCHMYYQDKLGEYKSAWTMFVPVTVDVLKGSIVFAIVGSGEGHPSVQGDLETIYLDESYQGYGVFLVNGDGIIEIVE